MQFLVFLLFAAMWGALAGAWITLEDRFKIGRKHIKAVVRDVVEFGDQRRFNRTEAARKGRSEACRSRPKMPVKRKRKIVKLAPQEKRMRSFRSRMSTYLARDAQRQPAPITLPKISIQNDEPALA